MRYYNIILHARNVIHAQYALYTYYTYYMVYSYIVTSFSAYCWLQGIYVTGRYDSTRHPTHSSISASNAGSGGGAS